MKHCYFFRTIFLTYIFIFYANCSRIRDKLYEPIEGGAACFRRHNGTHQFGCSSSLSGNVGVIHFVENETDIQWIEKNATAGPYTVVLNFSIFKFDILKKLENTNKVNGVLLVKSNERPNSYSPDDTCPNRYSGYKSCDITWNPYGSSILLEDWSFPIFYLYDDETYKKIKACYNKYNDHDRNKQAERSLCALEMKSFMYAALNSENCLRRSKISFNINPNIFCDPLGAKNIHWPLSPMNDNITSFVMVNARIDANSLFDKLVPGAGTSITGLVALLATAKYLHLLKPKIKNTNVLFTLFNGESFDYIGSSRVVYDMKEGKFNLGGKTLNLSNISSIVEFGQLNGKKLFLHSNNLHKSSLIENLQKNLSAEVIENSVPPTSLQSFLKENSSIPAVVIANHGTSFVNKYYNSILDDAEGLNYSSNKSVDLVKDLTKIVVGLGNELYTIISGENATNNLSFTKQIEEVIEQILPCYLESANCKLFQAASAPGTNLPNYTFPMYINVLRSDNYITKLTGLLLALLTDDEKNRNMNATECRDKELIWMSGLDDKGLCINTTLSYSDAVSPAFIIDDYDFKSGKYSTWTESVWPNLSMRMLLKPSAAVERLSLIIGSSVAGISIIIVWFINSKANIIFDTRSAEL